MKWHGTALCGDRWEGQIFYLSRVNPNFPDCCVCDVCDGLRLRKAYNTILIYLYITLLKVHTVFDSDYESDSLTVAIRRI
ncbi:hypothetical protein NSTC745_01672 [Nostoc sp. DSM 114161]|jgi:hypothetical protein|uniref:hypothetical protein n=1 Tax=Nostoc sp. DSM 114161 TaxID=3440143 RepID=UPI0040464733